MDGLRALDAHLVSLVAPASFEAERYRALRSRFEARRESEPIRVIAVTSAAIGDGKTTTAINLAGALAQSREARVLLVDADLRRPSVGRQFGWDGDGGPGLTDAILDPNAPLHSVVRRRTPLNLAILQAGRPTGSPYEVLKSPRLEALLQESRRQYDFVVIDTPPLIPVPDCRLIVRHVDGVVMVVAAHRTPRRLVREGLDLLDPARVVGLVFNDERRAPAGYYGYGGYGHGGRGGHTKSEAPRRGGNHEDQSGDPPIAPPLIRS